LGLSLLSVPHRVLINGQVADQIPISDRGLQYGDGLFETVAVIDSTPRFWQRHMLRLAQGESILGLPASDKVGLSKEAEALCFGCDRGVLKLIITRGSGGRGYRPPESPEPRRILTLHPWPDYPETWYREGIRLRLCETPWSLNWRLAGVKHLNRLDQVLARREWQDPRIAEGLMCDSQGRVISVTQGNLFLVRDGRLYTPDLSHAGIKGILREIIIQSASSLAIPLQITEITIQQVRDADALFVTNALLGLCPVAEMDGVVYRRDAIPSELCRSVADMLQKGI
jgi:4-amino-4-deoxychorismate lyase